MDWAVIPVQDQAVHPTQPPHRNLPPIQVVKQAAVPVKTQVYNRAVILVQISWMKELVQAINQAQVQMMSQVFGLRDDSSLSPSFEYLIMGSEEMTQ